MDDMRGQQKEDQHRNERKEFTVKKRMDEGMPCHIPETRHHGTRAAAPTMVTNAGIRQRRD